MATKITFPKEALLRYLSIYIAIAENDKALKLYVGKTGDNREGCNPIISRIGNHFSYNPIHSQLRNKIKNHEEWNFTFLFENFEKYEEKDKERQEKLDIINEMERWVNEKSLILADSFYDCELLNPNKLNLKFLSNKYHESFKLRGKPELDKVRILIESLRLYLLENHIALFKPKISILFLIEPSYWGLRGDSHLWKELSFSFFGQDLPNSFDSTKDIIMEKLNVITKNKFLEEKDFYVKKYDHGGMSNGTVSYEFWKKDVNQFLYENFMFIEKYRNVA